MEKEFKVGENLMKYLKMIGFVRKSVDSDKKYFVNNRGSQIKIDEKRKLIHFLNKKGFEVGCYRSINTMQLENFSRGGS